MGEKMMDNLVSDSFNPKNAAEKIVTHPHS